MERRLRQHYVKIEPFAGFMYALYAQLASHGPRPYTAMLFINYLMTAEGFAPWAPWADIPPILLSLLPKATATFVLARQPRL